MRAATSVSSSIESDRALQGARHRRRHGGFTLIEILIVVVILGILSAIVIPSFTTASSDARRSNARSTAQTLRSQIALYRLQHGDTLPDLTSSWVPLTGTTTFGASTLGPYLPSIPPNPMNTNTNVVNGTGLAAAGSACGYVYDYAAGAGSGKIWATDSNGTAILAQ